MSDAGTIRKGVKRSQIKYLKKYLLATEAFSQATAYLVFALICVWILTNDSPKPLYEFVILSIAALLSVCIFFMFTVFMFTPERVDNLRKWLILPSPSDSKIKKAIKLVFPVTIWLILFIIFLDGLFQGANRMPDNIRSIVILIGTIWLIVIPLSSIIKLSVVDEKAYQIFRFIRFWKRGNDKEKDSISPNENDQAQSMFRPDQPIQSYKEDLLDRASFARSLGDAILNYKERDSIVLGLLGTWGSGKTSIINMALEHIDYIHQDRADKTKPLIVRFNPWNYADQDQLIRQYFRQLSVRLRRKDYAASAEKIGIKLEAYARLLDPLVCIPKYGFITTVFSAILKLFGKTLTSWGYLKSNDLGSIKSELNKLLDKQERKIIIVIDDIDRLSDKEIRQTFQLVKSLGDFHNTLYLLAFDKKVAISALNRVQEGFGFEYLEKVVQVPFEIPLVPKQEIDKLLFSQLAELIKDVLEDKWDIVRWGNVYFDGLRHFFNTIRDVNRYINSLRFSLGMVREEVNIMDFLAITAIQVFIPEVYYGVRDNKEVFSGVLESTFGAGNTLKEQTKTRCDEVIGRTDKHPKEKVKELLKLLFPKLEGIYSNVHYDSHWLGDWRRDGRICSPDMFDIFFRLSIPKNEISRTELETILTSARNRDNFSESLLKLNEDGKIVRFLERLEDYTGTGIPEENIENIVTVLMDIGDIFPEGDTGFFGFNTSMRILRICHQLTRRLDSHEKRFVVFKNAIEKANGSLYTLVNEVSVQGQEHGKHGSKRTKPDDELTVNANHLEELEKLACSKIVGWADDGRLANHEKLVYVLYRWREWGDPAKVDSYVKDMIKTDDGLVKFIATFLSKVKSQGVGSYIGRIHWQIPIKNVASFIDINEVEPRLRSIFSSEVFNQLDARKQLAVRTFIDTVDGKIKDAFNDTD